MLAIMQTSASLLLFVAYLFYITQMSQKESTPNPGTWIIWFLIMFLNTLTYLRVSDDDYLKSAIAFISFACVSGIMVFAIIKGHFAKIAKLDIIIFILALIIGVFWQITANANLANLFLQIVMIMSFVPTLAGIWQRELKERYLAWLLSVIAYTIQTIAVLLDNDYSWAQLSFPVINGILGNGSVVLVVYMKKRAN